MGWKKFQEHYGINYSVHMYEGKIAIGSPYIPVIANVDSDGKITTQWQDYVNSNRDLDRIFTEIKEDPGLAAELIRMPDEFSAHIPVYSCENGEVITSYCEELEWPNNTHDGQIMYENVFFKTPEEAVKQAIRNQEATLDYSSSRLERAIEEVKTIESEITAAKELLAKYKAL